MYIPNLFIVRSTNFIKKVTNSQQKNEIYSITIDIRYIILFILSKLNIAFDLFYNYFKV